MITQRTAKAAHLLIGAEGEARAAAFLQKRGMRIIARNWRPPAAFGSRAGALELDIIAREGKQLVFVEVKSRRAAPENGFTPLDAFGPTKQKRVLKAAGMYLEEHSAWSEPCRFDLVCVIFGQSGISLEHHQNVLCFNTPGRGAMGGRNTPWQPW